MSPKLLLIFLAFVIVAALVESFADALFEKWSLVGKGYLLVGGLVVYAISSAFWAYSLKYETLSKGVVIFNVVNITLGVLIGVLYFKETLSTLNIAGITLGVASVILLSL
jgi:spermidine export protein MdtJ